MKHAEEAVKQSSNIFGLKGPTWLLTVQPDTIKGVAIVYMHTVLLGVARRHLSLWFDSSYSKEAFSLRKSLNVVDTRLRQIKPPNFISRTPRSISEHCKFWKASECRS